VETLQQIAARTGAYKPDAYLPIYQRLFEPVRFMPLTLLELGVLQGGSVKMWEAYFPYARIAGLDLDPPELPLSDRVRVFAGDQGDTRLLAHIAAEVAPDGFDIVIDDCAHIAKLAKASFWHLFDNHLKAGGVYCIEDWGTGYWPTWPDGGRLVVQPDSGRRMPSHDVGMVGFVKQLIDELSAPEIREGVDAPEGRASKFSEMQLYDSVCVVKKAAAELTRPVSKAASHSAERSGPLCASRRCASSHGPGNDVRRARSSAGSAIPVSGQRPSH